VTKTKSHLRKPTNSFIVGLSLSLTFVFALIGYSLNGLNQNMDSAQASGLQTSVLIANTNQESVKNLEFDQSDNTLAWSGFYFSDSQSCQQVQSSSLEINNGQVFVDVFVIESDDCAEFGDILSFSGNKDVATSLSQNQLLGAIVEIK
jgi:hypothetical protein